jgi:CRP/FNR family transcriptional regulator, cyclic AMP receptor protein
VSSRHPCQDEEGNRGGFLDLLADQDRAALERLGRPVSFRTGTTILHEGLDAGAVVLLRAGAVKATSITRDGHEAILAFRGPGDLLGELAAVDGRPHSSTVVAIEPVEALLVPTPEFEAFLNERPGASLALLRMVVGRFRDSDRRLIEFSASDALGRVAARLLELAETNGRPVEQGFELTLRLSQEELAGWAGCSTKAAVNALHTLRELGIVETARRRITVLDLEALRAHAA